MGTLFNNSKVGDKGKDLVLQTSGRVYVQVKERFYEINFRGDDKKSEEEVEETPRVIFVEDSTDLDESYPYPGDDYLIISNGSFYRTIDGKYERIDVNVPTITKFSTPLTINTINEAPLNVMSITLVKNLNAEYLNGMPSSYFAQKNQREVIPEWTIESLFSDVIRSKNKLYYLNLKSGLLNVDTIKVNNLITSSESTSIDGTTLENPSIILRNSNEITYLQLTNSEDSFIGINDKKDNFITISSNGHCDMTRDKMYNINNHTSTCSFGPIVVNDDGSATIGTGETQITISEDGTVKIPSSAIV